MSTYGNKVFGIRDVKVTNIGGTSQADLPSSQMLTIRPVFQGGRLQGDDAITSIIGEVIAYEWELGAGGIDLDALAIMTGETVAVAGSSPNETSTMTVSGGDRMPYFKIYGKSLGEGDDDVHVKLFKCKLESGPEGSLQGNQFFVSSARGVAIDDGVNGIIDIVQNETAANLPAS